MVRPVSSGGVTDVLAIFGPTASGKTAVAQALAERIPAELVSADSMQVYRGLPILTNQVPARLVGIWPLDHGASVAEYQRLAHAAIDEILAAGQTPLVLGLDVPKDELDRRIAERTRAMFEAGVRAEAGRALAGPVSSTAAYAHGLSDIAEHPDDGGAIEALTARTRRYAAYQRKWMRRIPGLVSLPADRPPGEVADAILEVARARQRLPAGRAG